MKNERPSFTAYKKRALQSKELKAAYDLLEPEFALLEKFIKARKKAHLKFLYHLKKEIYE